MERNDVKGARMPAAQKDLLVAALDDPGHVRSVGSFQFTAFAGGVLSVFAVCLVGLLGAVPALACAVLVDVLLARSLR